MLGVRVAYGVRDRLHHDPERGHLDRRGQRREVVDGERDPRAEALEGFDRLGERTGQAELVERCRAKAVADAAYLGNGTLHLVGQLAYDASVTTAGALLELPQAEADRRERGAEPVVQVAPQPDPFLLAFVDDVPAGGRQVLDPPVQSLDVGALVEQVMAYDGGADRDGQRGHRGDSEQGGGHVVGLGSEAATTTRAPASEKPPIWPRTSPPAGARRNLTTSAATPSGRAEHEEREADRSGDLPEVPAAQPHRVVELGMVLELTRFQCRRRGESPPFRSRPIAAAGHHRRPGRRPSG